MLVHEKDMAVATMIVTVVTIIGTLAALSYYLAISKYNTTQSFAVLLGGYFTTTIITYNFFNLRYKENVS